jgi:hypothetical protein
MRRLWLVGCLLVGGCEAITGAPVERTPCTPDTMEWQTVTDTTTGEQSRVGIGYCPP